MLERKDIQAVLIATPDNFHAGAVEAVARAGKDILCEKPLGVNVESAQNALNAVAKAGVRLQVGFMRHYDPAHVAASKRIEAGEIGEPVIFKSLGRDKDMPPLRAYQAGSMECFSTPTPSTTSMRRDGSLMTKWPRFTPTARSQSVRRSRSSEI